MQPCVCPEQQVKSKLCSQLLVNGCRTQICNLVVTPGYIDTLAASEKKSNEDIWIHKIQYNKGTDRISCLRAKLRKATISLMKRVCPSVALSVRMEYLGFQ
jgi:hypothetical protein